MKTRNDLGIIFTIFIVIVLAIIIFCCGRIVRAFFGLSPENQATVIIWSAGILVTAFAYLLKNFVFQPRVEYKKTVGKIRNRLKYYAGDLCVTLGTRIRSCASGYCQHLVCKLIRYKLLKFC